MMMRVGPVVGKLRSNLIGVNRIRSIADKVIEIKASAPFEEEQLEPFIRNVLKISLTNEELTHLQNFQRSTSWNSEQAEQLSTLLKLTTLESLWSVLHVLNAPLGDGRVRSSMSNDDPQTIAAGAAAVAEFNKQNNARLQFSRVSKGLQSCNAHWSTYCLTLEAVDDAHGVRTYGSLLAKENHMNPYEPYKVLTFSPLDGNRNERWINPIYTRQYDDRGWQEELNSKLNDARKGR